MIEPATLFVFLIAAAVIAVTPGPGIFYVAARALSGGRPDGMASSFGTGLGGMVHVAAGALGVSALVVASAEAFTALKIAGALYLIYLGIRTWRSAGIPLEMKAAPVRRHAFRDGVVVEALNPKTAAFFLAFLPQFVDPLAGGVALQFFLLGVISVALNTLTDVAVTFAAAAFRGRLLANPRWVKGLRRTSGAVMVGLGATLLVAERGR